MIDFRYRLPYPIRVAHENQQANVLVEVILHVRVERCPGPFELGDLVYSTTLLPGEKVRLFSADRRTRFSYDTESHLAYRNEQASEESFYMSSMADFMSDLTSSVQGGNKNTSSGSTTGHAETSGVLSSLFGSPSVDVSGSYNHSSVSDFMQELKQHAQSSHHRVEEGTRAASSISIGEVSTRTHAEGETQDQYEASSREFSNQNRCHAVTYLFYRVNKRQRVRITLEAIERRVRDAAAPTHVDNNRFLSSGGVSAVPTAILATSADRLEVEARARASVAAAGGTAAGGAAFGAGAQTLAAQSILPFSFVAAQPLPAAVREAAVRQVDGELAKAGLITAAGGQVTEKIRAQFLIETDSSLPTPGVIVRGCLDECDVCEPARKRQVELELERAELENQLLKRQIELLEKSQEYRCCPADEEEDGGS